MSRDPRGRGDAGRNEQGRGGAQELKAPSWLVPWFSTLLCTESPGTLSKIQAPGPAPSPPHDADARPMVRAALGPEGGDQR